MKIALLIPVFNHGASVANVIRDVRAALAAAGEPLPLIVVNDGSSDDTPRVLQQIPDITLLTHPNNRGKGAALRTGFRHAHQQGFTHVVTMDADGQHAPADVVQLVAAARQHPDELILGQRNMDDANVPAPSRKGRNATRFWLRVETGRDIADSQCGLRVYPLAPVLALRQRFCRFDYETEILARFSWAGIDIRTVPIACIYFPPEQRVTHFRPVIDTLRGIRVNVYLVLRRLMPVPFKQLAPPQHADVQGFQNWWKWQTWRIAIREAMQGGSSNAELAFAFAMGVFIGLTPLYFGHMLLAVYFSRRLHLNAIAAVIGTHISIWPTPPLWMGLSYALGEYLLHGEWGFQQLDFSYRLLGPLLVGNLVLATAVSLLSLIAARGLLYCWRRQPLPQSLRRAGTSPE